MFTKTVEKVWHVDERQNSRRQKDDKKKGSYLRIHKYFASPYRISRPGKLTPGICAPLIYIFSILMYSNWIFFKFKILDLSIRRTLTRSLPENFGVTGKRILLNFSFFDKCLLREFWLSALLPTGTSYVGITVLTSVLASSYTFSLCFPFVLFLLMFFLYCAYVLLMFFFMFFLIFFLCSCSSYVLLVSYLCSYVLRMFFLIFLCSFSSYVLIFFLCCSLSSSYVLVLCMFFLMFFFLCWYHCSDICSCQLLHIFLRLSVPCYGFWEI
jgi:hypothetical protein